MATKTKFGLKGKDGDSYLELILAFLLSSIRSDVHLDEAQMVMDRLLAKGELDEGEEMYLDALTISLASMRMNITQLSRHRTLTCFGIFWKPRESPRHS